MTDDPAASIARLEAEIAQLRAAIAGLAGMPDAQQSLQTQLDEREREVARLKASPHVAGGVRAERDAIIATNVTVHNYGAAQADVRVLLTDYLRALGGECNRLSLADADSSDPTRSAVELAAVYTGLEIGTLILELQDQPKLDSNMHKMAHTRQQTGVEVLAEHPRLVLLGSPGSGKSTLLNFVGLCLARASLGEPGWLERLERWPYGALLPIRVVLRELAAWLGAKKQRPRKGSSDLLWQWLRHDKQLQAPLVERLRARLSSGSALLLLDGLDEVSNDVLGLVVETIVALGAVAGASRVVVSCRVLDYQHESRQLPGWPSETIIPFSQKLQRIFIEQWFAMLARLSRPLNGRPDELRDRLQLEVVSRLELRRLAGNPLLLTMMTLVHAYEGQLPGERVRLYEKCVDYLLHSWRKEQRAGERPLRDLLGIDRWSDSDLRRLLDRLGFAAHTRGVSGDGEAGADLPRHVLIEEARQFFTPYGVDDDYRRAQVFCGYISRTSNGLLQQYGPELYRFPHRTFQEYLAARRLVSDGEWPDDQAEFVARALAAADRGPQWREALLLAVSQQVVVGGQVRPAANLSEDLLSRHPERGAGWARNAMLAGEVLAEVGRERLEGLGKRRAALWDEATEALVTVLTQQNERGAALVPVTERIRAAQVLGALGDPRFPVELEQWRAELARRNHRFGQPEGYFCFVPGGAYAVGGWKTGQGAAEVILSSFWVARLPVTIDQYAPFVAAGYGSEAERWWTREGWKWKETNLRLQPFRWGTLQYMQPNQPVIGITQSEAAAYCAWLSGQLEEVLRSDFVLRLPTEDEWEVAAAFDNAGYRRTYPWGEAEPSGELAILEMPKLSAPAAVGCCPAGAAACGALDMAGNVWERVERLRKLYPSRLEDAVRALKHDNDDALCGGAWRYGGLSGRCGARGNDVSSISHDEIGFRVVLAPKLAR